jgi:hypothetical protein
MSKYILEKDILISYKDEKDEIVEKIVKKDMEIEIIKEVYVIYDKTSNTGREYIGNDDENVDLDYAMIFNTEKEAQDYINKKNWNKWAVVMKESKEKQKEEIYTLEKTISFLESKEGNRIILDKGDKIKIVEKTEEIEEEKESLKEASEKYVVIGTANGKKGEIISKEMDKNKAEDFIKNLEDQMKDIDPKYQWIKDMKVEKVKESKEVIKEKETEKEKIEENYGYYLKELEQTLPIDEYGANFQLVSNNGKSKWISLNSDSLKALNDFYKKNM